MEKINGVYVLGIDIAKTVFFQTKKKKKKDV